MKRKITNTYQTISVIFLHVIALVFLTAGCSTDSVFDEQELQSGCSSADPRVGQKFMLSELHHDVSGNVELVDDCTLAINDFHYDGGGIHVRVTASPTGDFANGIHISENLKGTSFEGERLELPMPDGVTLDDVQHISIWCETVSEDFGSGTFDF